MWFSKLAQFSQRVFFILKPGGYLLNFGEWLTSTQDREVGRWRGGEVERERERERESRHTHAHKHNVLGAIGPLLYHFEDSRDGPTLELPLDDILEAARALGFEIEVRACLRA